jgi:hypothetical protein
MAVCDWKGTHQEQIRAHEAWRGDIDVRRAEALLQGSDPLTYLLRNDEDAYLITFVQKDQLMKHRRFTLDDEHKSWCCLGMEEIVSETLEELIAKIMQCDPKECKSLFKI